MLEMVVYDSPHPHAIIVMPGLHARPAPRPPDRKMDIGHCALLVRWK